MNLRDYICWANNVNEYEISPKVAKEDSWGFRNIGKVALPKIKFEYKDAVKGTDGYASFRHTALVKWARQTWPLLKCLDAKIQTQDPGDECKPHLDFLGYYLEDVVRAMPELGKVQHSLAKPGIDVWRMFVALDDHIDGQIFCINGREWRWRKGDCIRLDNWQALHWTKNNSAHQRSLIKITGILS
jgi:hypothetical protein